MDASRSFKRIGRMVNDGIDKQNAKMDIVNLTNSALPFLILFATKTIQPGDEILYDYGDHFLQCPWREKVT